MTRPTITIDGIEAEFIGPAEIPTFTRGQEETIELWFSGAPSAESDSGSEYSHSYPSSYSGTTTTTTFADTYDEAIDWLAFQADDMVRRGTTDRGVPWFRERITDDAPIDTLIVPLQVSVDAYRDVWAIIIGGEDNSNPLSRYRRLELDLFVLSPLDELEDIDAVRVEFGDELAISD